MDLPEELAELTNLSLLQAGNNRFIKLPDVIMKITSLTTLTTPYMMLTGIQGFFPAILGKGPLPKLGKNDQRNIKIGSNKPHRT